MRVASGTASCPKCDNDLTQQTDGSTVTVDIAHQGERLHEALAKLDQLVAREGAGVTEQLRLVVGGGLIRQAVMARLAYFERQSSIVSYEPERSNPGAVIVRLKPARERR